MNEEGAIKTEKQKLIEEFEKVWPDIGKLFPEDLRRKIKDLAATKLLKNNATKKTTDRWIRNMIRKSLHEAIPIIYYQENKTLGSPELEDFFQKIDPILNLAKPAQSKK